ncbi:MAG: hypothetical protein ACO1OO_13395 [Flavisolibacter sp.]
MADVKNRKQKNTNSGEGSDHSEPSTAEWIVGIAGFLLMISCAGFILYRAIWGSEQSPAVTIRFEPVETIKGGYLVRFSAHNESEETLADVIIRAELKNGNTAEESTSATIDYLPGRSNRKGGFFFRKNPADFRLEGFATSFEEP